MLSLGVRMLLTVVGAVILDLMVPHFPWSCLLFAGLLLLRSIVPLPQFTQLPQPPLFTHLSTLNHGIVEQPVTLVHPHSSIVFDRRNTSSDIILPLRCCYTAIHLGDDLRESLTSRCNLCNFFNLCNSPLLFAVSSTTMFNFCRHVTYAKASQSAVSAN